jgi:hypothetical protein
MPCDKETSADLLNINIIDVNFLFQQPSVAASRCYNDNFTLLRAPVKVCVDDELLFTA